MSRIAKRYAKALFQLTSGDLEQAKKQLASLRQMGELFTLPESARILLSPVMPADLKQSLLSYGLKQAAADEAVERLVGGVVAAGRVSSLPAITEVYADLIDQAEGVVVADVTASVALNADEEGSIGSSLQRLLNKRVVLRTKVDAALLGGFVVKVGHYLVDLSLRAKLDDLTKSAVQDSFVTR